VQGSGYQLANLDADKYTLTQPSVQADITRMSETPRWADGRLAA
jgi:hypothetical protein